MEKRAPTRLSPAAGRKFSFSVGAAFMVLAGISWWRSHMIASMVFALLAALLVLAGSVMPGRLGPVYEAWMGLALLISKVTTPIIMGVTYFVVLAPIGLLLRLFGRNPVVRKEVEGSFWVERPDGPKRRSDLTRQF